MNHLLTNLSPSQMLQWGREPVSFQPNRLWALPTSPVTDITDTQTGYHQDPLGLQSPGLLHKPWQVGPGTAQDTGVIRDPG